MAKFRLKTWQIVLGVLVLLFLAAGLYVRSRLTHLDDYTRDWVVRYLNDHFQSDAQLTAIHVHLLPRPGVTGEGLVLHLAGRGDLPPILKIGKFTFDASLATILHEPHVIPLIKVEDMVINMPPKGQGRPNFGGSPKPPDEEKKPKPKVEIAEIQILDTALVLLPKESGKEPLEWDIHNLTLKNVGGGHAFPFHGTLTNGKPKGEIDTTGTIGPWDSDDPGSTPVSGGYEFADADLGPFPGIAGILSSTGKYKGPLNELDVDGVTDTPDFSLDKIGRPVPLHTEYSATVDGTNGDTFLHPVKATLVHSLIICEGKVVRVPDQGHLISLDINTPDARIEDILNLAMNSDKPFMTGPVLIKAKLTLPPGKAKVIDKMILDGQFGVLDAKWSSAELREKLEGLSRRGEGKPGDEDAGSSISNLRGRFHLEKSVIHFSSLTFGVPGANIELVGNYDIHGGNLDFSGHLKMQAKLSQVVGGKKSFFLKAFDPFFAKNGAGTDLPITITGTRDAPVFGVSVFHKKFEKNMGNKDQKSDDKTDNDKNSGKKNDKNDHTGNR